jgi:hypothetical protein
MQPWYDIRLHLVDCIASMSDCLRCALLVITRDDLWSITNKGTHHNDVTSVVRGLEIYEVSLVYVLLISGKGDRW